MGSISKEPDLKPFWNAQCAAIASNLWLPTVTDWQDLAVNSFDKLSSTTVENSWFSTSLLTRQSMNLLKTCSISFTSSHVECTDLEITKSKLIKLSPTRSQKKIFKYWMTVSRYVFNWTIDFIRSCQNWTPNWIEIKKYATQLLPDWTKNCPFQLKGTAIKDATSAFLKQKANHNVAVGKHRNSRALFLKPRLKRRAFIPQFLVKA